MRVCASIAKCRRKFDQKRLWSCRVEYPPPHLARKNVSPKVPVPIDSLTDRLARVRRRRCPFVAYGISRRPADCSAGTFSRCASGNTGRVPCIHATNFHGSSDGVRDRSSLRDTPVRALHCRHDRE